MEGGREKQACMELGKAMIQHQEIKAPSFNTYYELHQVKSNIKSNSVHDNSSLRSYMARCKFLSGRSVFFFGGGGILFIYHYLFMQTVSDLVQTLPISWHTAYNHVHNFPLLTSRPSNIKQ